MPRINVLIAELEHEARTTRRHLERLKDDQFDWRPHAKSYTAGQLASHLVDCLWWTTPIFAVEELDLDREAYRPVSAASSVELLARFDEEANKAKSAMNATLDRAATGLWKLKMGGKVWFEKPREAAFRDMTFNHLIHHRGQFTVYLRLLDVPVPGTYGPTADDLAG